MAKGHRRTRKHVRDSHYGQAITIKRCIRALTTVDHACSALGTGIEAVCRFTWVKRLVPAVVVGPTPASAKELWACSLCCCHGPLAVGGDETPVPARSSRLVDDHGVKRPCCTEPGRLPRLPERLRPAVRRKSAGAAISLLGGCEELGRLSGTSSTAILVMGIEYTSACEAATCASEEAPAAAECTRIVAALESASATFGVSVRALTLSRTGSSRPAKPHGFRTIPESALRRPKSLKRGGLVEVVDACGCGSAAAPPVPAASATAATKGDRRWMWVQIGAPIRSMARRDAEVLVACGESDG
jgi:hypothetical protein